MNELDGVIDDLLRYHRQNPLRVAFGTPLLIALHGADRVQAAYQQLESEQRVEAMHHRVVREGAPRMCYRITKQGMKDRAP